MPGLEIVRRAVTGAAFVALAACPLAAAAQEVNLYTTRETGLIKPLLDAFTKSTGIKVNTVFVKDGLIERVKAEGPNSPADVLMTVDFGKLIDVVDQGVTQPVRSEALDAAIPANLRDPDGHWYALSLRARVVYVSKDRVPTHGDHLRGARRPEVEGQDLHPLRPAPLQHGADRRLHRPSRRGQMPKPGCAASRPISRARPPAATATSRATSSAASATSASAIPTTSA